MQSEVDELIVTNTRPEDVNRILASPGFRSKVTVLDIYDRDRDLNAALMQRPPDPPPRASAAGARRVRYANRD